MGFHMNVCKIQTDKRWGGKTIYYDKVVVLINKLLSKVVSLPNSPEGNRDRLKTQAISMAQR